jgi:hypothetical protein
MPTHLADFPLQIAIARTKQINLHRVLAELPGNCRVAQLPSEDYWIIVHALDRALRYWRKREEGLELAFRLMRAQAACTAENPKTDRLANAIFGSATSGIPAIDTDPHLKASFDKGYARGRAFVASRNPASELPPKKAIPEDLAILRASRAVQPLSRSI